MKNAFKVLYEIDTIVNTFCIFGHSNKLYTMHGTYIKI